MKCVMSNGWTEVEMLDTGTVTISKADVGKPKIVLFASDAAFVRAALVAMFREDGLIKVKPMPER
jgi:hypothetical protein